ncbi:MAG: helix-turn-helix transcriptional regulator [Microbacteriaceae bacterium]|nr:helix-turn-helix transcriptional regulator [Microbacteriaceae bacterium]
MRDPDRTDHRDWPSENLKEDEQFQYFVDDIHGAFGAFGLTQTGQSPVGAGTEQIRFGPLTLSRIRVQARQQESTQSETDSDCEEYVIGIPTELIKPRLAGTAAAGVATGVFPDYLSEMTGFAFSHAAEFDGKDARIFAQQMIDLVVASFGASSKSASSESVVLLQAAMDEATRRLGDPSLSVESLARHVNVSRRTLERLFADIGTSPARWILDRRLQAAKQELAGTTLADRPLEVIAQRWGFADRTHFSRVFREHFGVAPAHYRSQQAATRNANSERLPVPGSASA